MYYNPGEMLIVYNKILAYSDTIHWNYCDGRYIKVLLYIYRPPRYPLPDILLTKNVISFLSARHMTKNSTFN